MKKIMFVSGILFFMFLVAGTVMMLSERGKWSKGIYFRSETSYVGFTDNKDNPCEFEMYVIENDNIDFMDYKVNDCYIRGNDNEGLKASSYAIIEQESSKHYKIYSVKLYFDFKKEENITIKKIEFINNKTNKKESFYIGDLVIEYKSTKDTEEELVWGYTNILEFNNEYKFSIQNDTNKTVKISNIYYDNEKYMKIELNKEYTISPGDKKEIVIEFQNDADENDIVRFRPIIEYCFIENPHDVFYKTMSVVAVFEKIIPSEVLNDYLSNK